jgi:uncharacterized protein (DUF302 family)
MSDETLTKMLEATYEEALAMVSEALTGEGFGVLTKIDVKETLKEKLSVDFRRYKILGACNPSLAHEALQQDLDAGVMLPCNVLVYEEDDGRSKVLAVDPTATVASMGNPALADLAGRVKEKLQRAIAAL